MQYLRAVVTRALAMQVILRCARGEMNFSLLGSFAVSAQKPEQCQT